MSSPGKNMLPEHILSLFNTCSQIKSEVLSGTSTQAFCTLSKARPGVDLPFATWRVGILRFFSSGFTHNIANNCSGGKFQECWILDLWASLSEFCSMFVVYRTSCSYFPFYPCFKHKTILLRCLKHLSVYFLPRRNYTLAVSPQNWGDKILFPVHDWRWCSWGQVLPKENEFQIRNEAGVNLAERLALMPSLTGWVKEHDPLLLPAGYRSKFRRFGSVHVIKGLTPQPSLPWEEPAGQRAHFRTLHRALACLELQSSSLQK